MARNFLIILLIILSLIIVFVGVSSYGYNNLSTSISIQGLPKLESNVNLNSVKNAVTDWLSGNISGAIASFFILDFAGTITLHNPTFLPLYVPEIRHHVYINGSEISPSINTRSSWISPYDDISQQYNSQIELKNLPQQVQYTMSNKGSIDIEIISEFNIGSFTISKSAVQKYSLRDLVSRYNQSTSTSQAQGSQITKTPTTPPLSVNFQGWYANGANVSSANEGDSVTAIIALNGGDPGRYTMHIGRDVKFVFDKLEAQTSFNYDGNSTTQQLTFVPTYGGGESGTRGYWVELLKGTKQVWHLSDDYPPRLKVLAITILPSPVPQPQQQLPVPSVPPKPLTVNFNGWYVDGNYISTTTKSKAVTSKVTISDGSAAQYMVRIRRDVSLGTDQTVTEHVYSYSGPMAVIDITFSAPYATGEANTRGYYVEVLKEGTIVWAMGNGYPPRLVVSPPAPTLPNVIIQNVDIPAAVTAGPSYTYYVIIKNNESYMVNLTLKVNSSATGDVASISCALPANGSKSIQVGPTTFGSLGIRVMTYTILFEGKVLNSVLKSVNVQ